MTEGRTIENEIEAIARRIALENDLDPDDCRLGKPAWQIDWILEQATEIIVLLTWLNS